MNRIVAAVAGCVLAAGVASAFETENLPDLFPKGAAVLFIGDSVTHGGRLRDMNHHLGHGYQAEIAMRYMAYRPELQIVFANRGVSGDTSSNIVARLKTDAYPFTANEGGWCGMMNTRQMTYIPDVISILDGINDAQRTGLHHVEPEDYERNLRTIVAEGYKTNANLRVVLCEPFKVNHAGSTDMRILGAEFLRRQGIVARLANELGVPCVMFQRLYNEILLKAYPTTRYWFWDAAHPTYAAHMRMADFWIESVAVWQAKPTKNAALRPMPPRYEADRTWYDNFAARVEKVRTADVVGLGESEHASERTENLLWALDHGLLDGARAGKVIVTIGANNRKVGSAGERVCTEAEIAEARAEIARRVKEKLPKVLIEMR